MIGDTDGASPESEREPVTIADGLTQWRLLRQLNVYIRPYRGWLVLAIVATAAGGLLGLGFPWVLGSLVDSALDPAASPSELGLAAAALLAIFATQSVLASVRIYTLAYAGQHIVNSLRSALFNNMIRLPMSFLDRRSTGTLTSRLMSDAAFAYGAVSGAGPQMVNSLITVVGGAALMVWIQPALAMLVLALLPIAGLVARHYGRRMRRLSSGYQNGLAAANALAGDSLSAAPVVKLFSAESTVARFYHRRLDTVIEQGMERARARSLWTPVTMFLTGLGVVAVVWFGGRQVQAGSLTAGALVSFLLYARFVATGTSTLVTQYSRLAQASGATERVITLLQERREPLGLVPASSVRAGHASDAGPWTPGRADSAAAAGSTPQLDDPSPSPAHVRFDHVSFSYPTRKSGVLNDIDLSVEHGETVAVVGQSGAGKSTLVRLIGRLYDVDSGTVSVDGVDVRQHDLTELRRSIAVVPQDVMLVSGTIADNIRLGHRSATRDEVADAARAANAHQFITHFPRGYGTMVGDRGNALSGGQRQRIAIARALLADPRLLILDEATNALDPLTEASVTEAMGRLMAQRTNIIIAHRLSTIMNVQRVVVLEQGRVVEQGVPADLLHAGGHFSALVAGGEVTPGQPGQQPVEGVATRFDPAAQ